MVNGLYLHSAFLDFLTKALLHHCHIHPFTQHIFFYIDAHYTPTCTDDTQLGGNLQFGILPKDTLTHGLEELGIKPPPFQSVGNRSVTWATAIGVLWCPQCRTMYLLTSNLTHNCLFYKARYNKDITAIRDINWGNMNNLFMVPIDRKTYFQLQNDQQLTSSFLI